MIKCDSSVTDAEKQQSYTRARRILKVSKTCPTWPTKFPAQHTVAYRHSPTQDPTTFPSGGAGDHRKNSYFSFCVFLSASSFVFYYFCGPAWWGFALVCRAWPPFTAFAAWWRKPTTTKGIHTPVTTMHTEAMEHDPAQSCVPISVSDHFSWNCFGFALFFLSFSAIDGGGRGNRFLSE